MARRVVIMGAAGRDFHNFNMVFRDNPAYEVVAFTATQIPDIAGKVYPTVLAGALYPQGVPIIEETELSSLLEKMKVDEVLFAYSDVPHEEVMHKASLALSKGADFSILGSNSTMLSSRKPVVSVTATRTGCGKSPTSRKVAHILRAKGKKVVVIRHPMPYGDLSRQIVQRFATLDDLAAQHCTIEEMEEYEPHIQSGSVVYAGVDYGKILAEAEKEADIILWDGGNNDFPFIQPSLDIVLTDPHRLNHERRYHPGETNFLRAQVIVITKVDSADRASLDMLVDNIARYNPKAKVVRANLAISVDREEAIRDKNVLVVEDGPTLTHGGMSFGAGILAAKRFGSRKIVDPKPFLMGEMRATFEKYPFIKNLLPAMGYGKIQIKDLEETIHRVPCDTVVIATPIDLRRVCHITQETCRVRYDLEEIGTPTLSDLLAFLG